MDDIRTNILSIDRKRLLEVLEENKKKHMEEYAIAMENFRKDVIEEMTNLLEDIKNRKQLATMLTTHHRIPASYEKDYNKAIKRYKLHNEPVVYLDEMQVGMLIHDEWQWKHNLSNTFYASKK